MKSGPRTDVRDGLMSFGPRSLLLFETDGEGTCLRGSGGLQLRWRGGCVCGWWVVMVGGGGGGCGGCGDCGGG